MHLSPCLSPHLPVSLRSPTLPPSLTRLDLTDNDIGDGGCRALAAPGVQGPSRMRKLALRGNRIGNSGAASLARSMQRGGNILPGYLSDLVELQLGHNRPLEYHSSSDQSGITAIAAALPNAPALIRLDLGGMSVGTPVTGVIVQALRCPPAGPALRYLVLDGSLQVRFTPLLGVHSLELIQSLK